MFYSTRYELFHDDESLSYINDFEAKSYNQSTIAKAKKELEEYIILMDQFQYRLVLSPLNESSRGNDYIIYNVSFENTDIQTIMTIKATFDDEGYYRYWEEI